MAPISSDEMTPLKKTSCGSVVSHSLGLCTPLPLILESHACLLEACSLHDLLGITEVPACMRETVHARQQISWWPAWRPAWRGPPPTATPTA